MQDTSKKQSAQVDIVIFGAGIAGLWAYHALQKQGYQCILLDPVTVGGQQSINSQGIIHGGVKYTLKGKLTGAAQSIASMPVRWREILEGQSSQQWDPKLNQDCIFTNRQYMFSTDRLASGLASFFASKSLRGKVNALNKSECPEIFQNPNFHGKVYQLNEQVLDIPSVFQDLWQQTQPQAYQYDFEALQFETKTPSGACIQLGDFELHTSKIIFAAGQGNAELIARAKLGAPAQQLRPVHMVLVKGKQLPNLFGHAIALSKTPLVTISSHQHSDGERVWYLGGGIAEDGVKLSQDKQIQKAKQLLNEIFPWLSFEDTKWQSCLWNRAEPSQASGQRPDTYFLHEQSPFITLWPTKLTLTPAMIDELVRRLAGQRPTWLQHPIANSTQSIPLKNLPMGQPIWEQLFH